MEVLKWLTDWYKSNCNGDWEHSYGIKIDTLDNPGWHIHIDLLETSLEGKLISEKNEKNDNDWYSIISDGETFKAYGDMDKLGLLFDKFREFVELNNLEDMVQKPI